MSDIVNDPGLAAWGTETQKRYLEATIETGSYTGAASKLGVHRTTIRESLRGLAARAAAKGYSPDHNYTNTVPDPFIVKGVSQMFTYDEAGNKKLSVEWVKSRADGEQLRLMMEAATAAMAEEVPRLPPLPRLTTAQPLNEKLLNVYTLTDCHVGMLSWGKETGAPWDLKIAEDTLTRCFGLMIENAPDAAECIVNQLGDFLHWDGLAPVTPTSGHILDADGRFSKMVQVAVRVLRRIIDHALTKHEKVWIVMAEGNHDMASSVWLRVMFAALYENEPRVQVIQSEVPFYAHQHGETMLAFHHGHLKKPDEFPLLFAAQYPKVWGETTKRYAHAGHQHHLYEKEHGGMYVTQHPTLAAKDAYAARGGWFSERAAHAITYHSAYGQVLKTTVTPEMLD